MKGKRLAHYEVVDTIGAGGMGEVFRARDTKLGREVALKVLPAVFADDPERLGRFKREAQLLAAFNHPNIATLFGFEEVDGTYFLAMELVDGVDISQRLAARGPLPLREALRVAAEVAEAMQAAHAQGIVHRDLKPANIKLTSDERVKVLDFGLAKAIAGDAAGVQDVTHSPTLTGMGTIGGVILGTAAYMSPEQARGQPVDKLSDIWALGCVLYEMLTGRRAFGGDTVSDTLVGILERDPDWSALPADTPPVIVNLLRRCLQKDKRQRLQDVGDARIELRECLSGASHSWNAASAPSVPGTTGSFGAPGVSSAGAAPNRLGVADVATSGSQASATQAAPRSRAWIAWSVMALVAGAALGLALSPLLQPETQRQTLRVSITAPPQTQFVPMGDYAGPATLSPDGTHIAFTTRDSLSQLHLWVRPLAEDRARRLEGTMDATFPFWSHDGRSLGFFADGRIKRVELAGGSPITLADARNGRGGTWSANGTILYAPNFQTPLFRVSASGGVPVAVTELDTTRHTTHRWPRFLPDGEHFLFVAAHHDQGRATENGVYFGSPNGEAKRILQASTEAIFTMDHLLYVHDNSLMSVAFDARSGTVSGNATPLIDKVRFDPSTWKAALSASQTGMLAYHGGGRGTDQGALSVFDRAGILQFELNADERHIDLALSPDAKQIVAAVGSSNEVNLWIYDLQRTTRTRLTFQDAAGVTPLWSPDGNRIAYSVMTAAAKSRFYSMDAEGGDQRLLMELDGYAWLTDWGADGRFLLFSRGDYVGGDSNLWILPLRAEREPLPLRESEFYEDRARFSPDGRWVAYRSNESGDPHIYVAAFEPPSPDGTPPRIRGKWQVSTIPGVSIDWNTDGSEIYYITLEGTWMAASVDGSGNQFRVGRVTPLFECNPWYLGRMVCTVSRDGRTFAVTTHRDVAEPPITLVIDWLNEQRD